MKTLRLVLGDQLSRSLSALRDVEISQDVVLMVEAHEETTYVRHHRQKIVLVLSAMRHFAESLRAEGLQVDYVRLDAAGHSGSFTGELGRALSRHPVDRIVVTEPGEWRVWGFMQTWGTASRVRARHLLVCGCPPMPRPISSTPTGRSRRFTGRARPPCSACGRLLRRPAATLTRITFSG
jgi:deoxyribodipyrimidine photolyase-like uncharacterized protein